MNYPVDYYLIYNFGDILSLMQRPNLLQKKVFFGILICLLQNLDLEKFEWIKISKIYRV